MKHLFSQLALCLILAQSASAQLISLKTVPVSTGDQFLLTPSQNLGMGGSFLAIDDPLGDHFENPAKEVKAGQFFSTPTFYRYNNAGKSGRTLPIGANFANNKVFGAASWTMQQLVTTNTNWGWGGWCCPSCFCALADVAVQSRDADRASQQNHYVSGSLGYRVPHSKSSIGASVFYAKLNEMDGITLLYPNANEIVQEGNVQLYKMGYATTWGNDRRFEALALLHRVDMKHDVRYQTWVWDEKLQTGKTETRIENNADETNTFGVHLKYRQPISNSWRLAFATTANFKAHPHIPNYEIMNVPRDPGNSQAFNYSAGLARITPNATFGIDVSYQPVWSHTWADTIEPIKSAQGNIIPKGGKTVDNRFVFNNTAIQMGLSTKLLKNKANLQLGIGAFTYDYNLKQENYVENTKRNMNYNWTEWTSSLGLAYHFKDFDLRYVGRMTTGTGTPFTTGGTWNNADAMAFSGGARADILVAPQGGLGLSEAPVVTHQLGITIPIKD